MVAIVTGNGAGLGKSSAEVLGQGGQLGLGQLPGVAGNAYINATTGNLIIQRQDELLIGQGPDIGVYQTYNSQGNLNDFDNNDNWQVSLYRQVAGLTGGSGVNTAGSTITRTSGDGTTSIHSYDAVSGKYISKDGAGSYDTLSYNATNKVWTWQDGDSRITESYSTSDTTISGTSKWKITTVTDLDNKKLTYTYSAATGLTDLIDTVTTENGEITKLIYNSSKQLIQIDTTSYLSSGATVTTRVRYTYDNNRLKTVTTDLSPSDNSVNDGKTYVTTYEYVDTSSKLIASIATSDGRKVGFTYDGNRINGIKEYTTSNSVESNTVQIVYNGSYTTVTTTNNSGTSQTTKLTYDANGQLLNLQGPTDSGQNVSYSYNANGDVVQVTDSRGNWTKYTYDTQGNQVSRQDNMGNTVTRTYGSNNELLTETLYTIPDANVSDNILAATGAQTTRYIYSADGKNHLRFIISPEGRVTEYRYTGGLRTSDIQYTGLLYSGSGTVNESQMSGWVSTTVTDKSKSKRIDYGYDFRGALQLKSTYPRVSGSTGAGPYDDVLITMYTYDQAGNLLQVMDSYTEEVINSYTYDGLNRIIYATQVIDPRSMVYNDSSATITNMGGSAVGVTIAANSVATYHSNGLVTISSYDLAGRLITQANTNLSNTNLGSTTYAYDKLGNLRMMTDPAGQSTYYLYDSANRKVGEIDPNKNLTEWVYNNNGQVIRTIQYNNPVTATLNATTALTNTLSGVRPTLDTTNDRTSYRVYDQAGRLSHEIDALGYVTEYQYDGTNRLLKTVQYNTVVSAANLDYIKNSSTDVYGINGSIKGLSGIPTTNTLTLVADNTNDRINRNLYDNDGKLVGLLDAEGYLTEYIYDGAGQRTRSIRYAALSPSAQLASGTLASLRPALDANNDQTTHYIYNARGELEGMVDALGYLTEYQYDRNGNKSKEIRYITPIAYVLGNRVAASRPGATPEDRTTTYEYDSANRLLSMTTPEGLIAGYGYDAMGNLISEVRTFDNANYDKSRVILRQFDQLGRVTKELSGEGRVKLVEGDLTAWDTYGTRYNYDNAGRLISKIEPNGVNAVGNKTLHYYDNEGKLRYTINALGEVSETFYNSFDQISKTRRYDTRISNTTLATLTGGLESTIPAATLAALVSGGASEVQLGYDKLGQVISTTDELLNVNSRTYNAFGELKNRTDKTEGTGSAVTSYQYDRRGALTQTKEDDGGLNRITKAVYDAFGRVTQTTDGRSNIINHTYDRLGREVITTDALSQNTITTYDAFSRVLTRKDERSNTVTYSYNTATRTMTMTTAEGVVMETVKNQFGETVSIKDGRGSITSYEYNADGQRTKTTEDSGDGKLNLTKSVTYDKAGRVFQTRSELGGVPTEYTYDAANRVLSRLFWTEDTEYETGFNIKTSYHYDAQGRQIWTQDPNGTWTKMEYDAKGQLTKITTDPSTIPTINNANGLVLGTTNKANALNLITSYSYDARGKKLTVTEGEGSANPRTTKYTYDKLGRLKSSVIDPGNNKLNITTSYEYDQNDNVVLKTDPGSNKTVYTYDANNRLVYTVDALGYVTKNDYDANGNITSVRAYSTPLAAATLATLRGAPVNATVTPSAQSTDRVTRYAYDKDNRLTYITNAAWYVTRNEYDANGNVVKQIHYVSAATAVSDTGGVPTVGTSGNDRIEQTVYDAANRVKFSIDANNYVTANSYNYFTGNLTKTVRYATAMVGTLITNTGPQILTSAGSGNYVLTSSADRASYYYYDVASRLSDSIDAEGYRKQYGYDNAGRLTSESVMNDKPRNVTENGWTRPENFTGWNQDNYYYDAAGRLTIRINGINSGYFDLRTDYTYDAMGNQVQITQANGGAGQERITQQRFDAAGRKTEVIDGEGKSTKTEYNAVGDIVKVTDALNNVGYFYTDALGRVSLQVDPEGAVIETKYDAFGNQLEVIRYANKITVSGTAALGVGSSIKLASTVLSNEVYVLIDKNKDQKQTIEYNKLDQKLFVNTWTAATDNTAPSSYYTEGYTYNAFGDVATYTARNKQITVYGYDKQGHKLSESFTGITVLKADNSSTTLRNTFTYDAFGNLATKVEADSALTTRTTTYGYDKLNRQILATQNVQTTTGASAPAVTQKTYDARGNVTAEKDAKGQWTYYYYDLQDHRVGTIKADGSYTAWTYDAVGNIIKETKYSNKIQTKGTATLASAQWIQAVGIAPTNDAVFVITDVANDRVTEYTYDKVGRQTGTKISNITAAYYDIQLQEYQVVLGDNIATKTDYDALGNIIKQTDGNSNVTRSWYNKAGQLVAKLDAEGYLTTWDRDVYGNISKETRYATKPANAATNPLTVNDATTLTQLRNTASTLGNTEDRITNIVYDKLNRVNTETVLNVQVGSVNATGILTAAAPATVTTSYLYDGLNNVIQKTDTTSAVTNWVYDGLGRQTSVINPQFTDYQGATVRTRTDKEYDGLNNVTRELRRGTNDAAAATLSAQVESDDQITIYTYGAGGRLISEQDATQAVIQYEYDLNGNLTQQKVLGRKNADGESTNDITAYYFDSLNRQVKTTDQGTGVIQEVQYNTFGEITGKRTYTGVAPASTFWDEKTDYDRTGHVWKSNSGNGVTKVYINDKNGNVTATIISTLNINNMTLVEVLSQKAIDAHQNAINAVAKQAYEDKLYNFGDETLARVAARSAAYSKAINLGYDASMANDFADRSVAAIETNFVELTPRTFYTYSVYDGKNQLVNTIQASMDSIRSDVAITDRGNGGTLIASVKSQGNVTQVTPSVGGFNPVTGGAETVLSNTLGEITVTQSAASVSTSASGSTVRSSASQSISFNIGAGFTGTVKVTVSFSHHVQGIYMPLSYDPPPETKTVTNSGVVSFSFSSSLQGYLYNGIVNYSRAGLSYIIEFIDDRQVNGVTIPNRSSNVYDSSKQAFLYPKVGDFNTSLVSDNGSSRVIKITPNYQTQNYKSLYLAGLPTNTDKVLILKNNNQITSAIQVKNTGGAPVPGMFVMESNFWEIGSTQEIQYIALDANGNVLMQKQGVLSGNSFTSKPFDLGNAGQAAIVSFSSEVTSLFNQNFNLQLFNQPASAYSATMRYRIKGSNDNWSSPLNSVKPLPGWLGFYTNTISFALNTAYDIIFTIKDFNGNTISQSYTEITTSPNAYNPNIVGQLNIGKVNLDRTVRFTQPVGAQYLDVKFRRAGTTDPYSTTIRLDLASKNSGQFDFSTYGFTAGDYEFDIKAINNAGILINHNQITATIDAAGAFTVNNNTPIDVPQVLKINPRYDLDSEVLDLAQLSYRLANSTSDFLPLDAHYYYGSSYYRLDFRAELPTGFVSGDYEYRYTTFNSELVSIDPVTTLFAENFNGTSQSFTLPASGVSVTGAGTPSGNMTITAVGSSTNTSPTTYLGASSPTYDYVEGMTLQAEITTGAASGRRGMFGLEVLDNDGNINSFMLDFDGSGLYTREGYITDSSQGWVTGNGIKPNTTYVVQYSTDSEYINATIYEKGQDPESGFHYGFYFGETQLKTFHLQSYAVSSPNYKSLTPATLNAAALKIDNISLVIDRVRTLTPSVRTGTFTVNAASSTSTQSSVSNVEWYVASEPELSKNIISRSQSFNAFGEIVSETDGRGNVTNYTYNTMGAMTQKIAPTVIVTAETGAQNTTARPVTEYTYDALGRVTAVKDANGNVNTQVWRNGTADGDNIVLEKHADGGIKSAGYDIFGNKRTEYDELATSRTTAAADAIHRIDYTYDNENRLVKVEHQARNDGSGIRSVDEYAYDAAGNRISHKNAKLDTEKTYYDSLGRVTKTTSFMNFDTNYTYNYVNDIVGVGGAIVSGWQKTTTDAMDRTLVDRTDMFNHVTWHQDLGKHQFTYVYNQAGWLTSQNSLGTGLQYSGQNIVYSYYNNGFIKSIHDKALGMYTYYEYDDDGNRSFEGYVSLKEATNLTAGAKDYYQYATIKYDALNRITNINDPKADISYEYDAVGNRRMVKSVYHDGVSGSMQVQEYWYKYDSMNRFLITMGKLSGNKGSASTTITEGTTGNDGVSIMYDKAGRRISALNAKNGSAESYSYTNDGYLTNVHIKENSLGPFVLRSSRNNDELGRVKNYKEYGANGNQSYFKDTTYDKDNRVLSENGDDGLNYYYYYTNKNDNTVAATGAGQLGQVSNKKGDTTVTTYYAYQYWDEAKQFAITNQGYNPSLKSSNAAWRPGYSELTYNVNGHLSGAVDREGNRSFRYVNDAQGLILSRNESAGSMVNRVQRYYYVDGKRVGEVGNDGPNRTDYVQAMASRGNSKTDYKNWKPIASADFDQNYEPISPSYPGFSATTYTVKNGDTLQSIARTVWGDADMWYLIADANGLTAGSNLTADQVLTIPNKVTNIHNNSGTYRVYNPGEAIGDVSPTLPTAPPPPKKKKKCGGFAMIIVAVVAVVATVLTAGALAPVVAGQSLWAAGIGALGSAGSLGFGGAFLAGAVGSIAGQAAGMALGVQDKFSWGAVATAGLTSGVLNTGPMKALTQAVGGAVGGGYAAVATRAVVGNVVGQGIGNITGSQKGFSWSSVAVSAITAPVAAKLNDTLFGEVGFGGLRTGNWAFNNPTAAAFAESAVGAGVSALTQLSVQGGKLNWSAIAADTLSGFIQSRELAMSGKELNVIRGEAIASGFDQRAANAQLKATALTLMADESEINPKLLSKLSPTAEFMMAAIGDDQDKLRQILNSELDTQTALMADNFMFADAARYAGGSSSQSGYAQALGISESAMTAFVNGNLGALDANEYAALSSRLGRAGVGGAMVASTADVIGGLASVFSNIHPGLGALIGGAATLLDVIDQYPSVKAQFGQMRNLVNPDAIASALGNKQALELIPGFEDEPVQKAFQSIMEESYKLINKVENRLVNIADKSGRFKAGGELLKLSLNNAKERGIIGEALTGVILERSGLYEESSVRAIQNNSGHGIDMVGKAVTGKHAGDRVAFEVKTSAANNFKFNKDQKLGANAYMKMILDRATPGTVPWWSNVKDVTAFAKTVRKEMEGKEFAGYIIKSSYVNTNPHVTATPWTKFSK